MKKAIHNLLLLILLFGVNFALAASDDFNFDGGTISLPGGGTEVQICSGDGFADPINVIRENWEGMSTFWVITNTDGTILNIVNDVPIDFEGAGGGTCLIWHLAVKDFTSSFEIGMHKDDVTGWLDYSNSITVVRNAIAAASINTGGVTELEICAGDGISDEFSVSKEGGVGNSNRWLITDSDLKILAISTSNTFDLEGAGAGTCLIWHLSFNSIAGNVVGLNAANMFGCFALSNPITVHRGTSESATIALEDGAIEIEICAGDGVSDEFTPIVTGGSGDEIAWVITDTDLNILGVPPGPSFDLDGAGEGTCLIWQINYSGSLAGAEVGLNAGNLSGCFALSNAITVTRKGVVGASISLEGGATEFTMCAGDGVSDAFTPIVEGGEGENSSWVITDSDLNILGLPDGPTFDLEGAGAGTCLVWHISSNGDITGAEVGMNAGDLGGCLALSNAITVTRNGVGAATIALEGGGTELETCAGDGISDAFTVTSEGGMGESNDWIITDIDLNILGLPEGPTFDLEGAGTGTCLVWYVSYNGELTGVEVGANAADIGGCFVLSNAITVTRKGVVGASISLEGGAIEFTMCAGDGVSDAFTPIVEGGEGDHSSWVITDSDLNILGLPEGPTFDLEGAGAGTCLVWHISSNGDITGAEVGMNAGNLVGCLALSNAITVTRNGIGAATIALEGGGTELETCAGDGVSDAFTVTSEGGMGESNDWIITDIDLNILGLPAGPTFDLEGAGTGTCLVWHVSYNGELTGVEVGANAADFGGCFILSNAITVTRKGVVGASISLEGGATEFTMCAGDGVSDAFTPIVEGGEGDNSSWVITDSDLNILGLPEGPTFDLEGAGAGTCLVWHISSNGDITGAEVGLNAGDLVGCLALSNAITVTRNGVAGGSINLIGGGTEMFTCAGDGIADEFTVFPDGMAIGENSRWVITDTLLNILGLPEGPTFDLEGAGEGVCLVWYISYNGEITGTEVGMNVANLVGCLALSNSIKVVRQGVIPAALSLEGGGDEISICVGDGISDAFSPVLDGGNGEKEAWIITDTLGNILGLPLAPPFDLEGAGAGTCLIWHLTYNGSIFNIDIGLNANEIEGCTALSNPITVTRNAVAGGVLTIEGGETALTICAGDGISDTFNVVIDSFIGDSTAWVITDQDLNILGLPSAPPFDLEGAGAGVCLIWHVAFNGELEGAEVGMNAADLIGCHSLSNAITVTRVTEGDLCGGLLLSKHVDIFPNPSMDEIKITTVKRLTSNFELSIYDMVGNKLRSYNKMNQSEMKINISDLQSGVYFLSIRDGEQSTMKQFVKM